MDGLNRRAWALTFAGGAALPFAKGKVRDVTQFQGDVRHWMEVACVPGAAVAALRKGRVESVHGFGTGRGGQPDAVDGNTIFEAASLSKPVFASAVLHLADEKALDPDQSLYQILPLSSDPGARAITARHLLSHSSGLQNWRSPQRDQFEFAFPPGSRFSYSGEGYFYLRRVVEKITRTPFARYMREDVLETIGMTRSSYVWRENPSNAAGHDYRHGLPLPDFMQPNAASSLRTTANDYAKFLQYSFAIRTMRQPQVKINSDLSWGLGCGLETAGSRQWFWHWGDNPGFKNFFIADPGEDSAILVFTNGDGGARLYQRIVRNALGSDFSAFLWI
jgi:CubicO group peptidase (beta-lactamase class C family)